VRTIADAGGEAGRWAWLAWLSPLGWLRLTRAFAGERWWVFALVVGLVAALVAAAYAIVARRDLGAGLLPSRLGRAAAAPGLRSALALVWRLQRGALLAWAAAAALLGGLLGAVGAGMARFADTPQIQSWVRQSRALNGGDAFLFLITYILGQVVSAYAIATVLGMRAEELDGRADPLLATPVSRLRWVSGYLFVAFAGPAAVLTVLGLAIGLGYGLSAGDVGQALPRLLARTLVMLPAIWVMAGIAMALYGLRPRMAIAGSWAALAAFLALELGWELRQVSQTVFNLSPFAYVHWARSVSAAALMGLIGVAAALSGAGLLGFRRRDIV